MVFLCSFLVLPDASNISQDLKLAFNDDVLLLMRIPLSLLLQQRGMDDGVPCSLPVLSLSADY